MNDFIELKHVYLINATPYSLVVDEGANKGKKYEGFTYTFLVSGVQKKLSSDKVDLRDLLSKDKEPVGGVLRLGIKDDKGAQFKAMLLGFDEA